MLSVTELHQVSRLVDFTLETTKGRFDGFSISNGNLDVNAKFRRRAGCRSQRKNPPKQLNASKRKDKLEKARIIMI